MATKTKTKAAVRRSKSPVSARNKRKPAAKKRRAYGSFSALLSAMKVNDRIRVQPRTTLASLRVQTYLTAARLGIKVTTGLLTKTLLVTRIK